MPGFGKSLLCLLTVSPLAACEIQSTPGTAFSRTGVLENPLLDEVSGLQASKRNPGVYFVHNDDGKARIYAIDETGADLGAITIKGADNRDWEDITWAPADDGPMLVVGDVGDNFARRDHVTLYFIEEPATGSDGRYSGKVDLRHQLAIRYPDGPRDIESMAYDPASGRIFLMSKRDKPPRLYSILLTDALSSDEAELRFEGETTPFRPPTARDMIYFGKQDGQWVSTPTGLDFRADGTQAAVITTRSLYLFERGEAESWESAFLRQPLEIVGPAARQEEAVAYAHDGMSLVITTEKLPAPVYSIRLIPEPGTP